ncbi:MAG: hypothetical protein ORN28_07060 [Rhodoferax sp.]|nr:hypothetical protein [Rhodoferax sp.]
MNYSDKYDTNPERQASHFGTAATAVLAGAAGIPFQPAVNPLSDADPFAEWLSLMEVVHMLCPVWPVPDKPIQGTHWLL